MFSADLHIHSCLSPCGALTMSAAAIVDHASARGLSMIALCDHNAAANCRPVWNLAAEKNITLIPGLEVTTAEEAHVLTLFKSLEEAEDFAHFIYNHLPSVLNDATKLGDQVIVDETGEILGEIDKYLGMATDLSVDALFEEASSRGALVIPSHIDRPYAGLISQLGFLPDIDFHGVEIAFEQNQAKAGKYTAVTSSDAHLPQLIGSKQSVFELDEPPGFDALKNALTNKGCIKLEFNHL